MYKIDWRGGVQKSFNRTDPGFQEGRRRLISLWKQNSPPPYGKISTTSQRKEKMNLHLLEPRPIPYITHNMVSGTRRIELNWRSYMYKHDRKRKGSYS